MTNDECGMTKETRMTSNDVRRNFVIRHSTFVIFSRPPTAAFAPAGSERSFDCAPQSLRSAQDDGMFFPSANAPPDIAARHAASALL